MTKFFKLLLCCMLVLGLAIVAGCSSTNKASNEKVFRVGMECGYAPFNWTQTNADNGAVQIKGTQEYANGYDVMIAKQIAEAMGAKLEIHKIEWDGLTPAVNAGKIDAVIAGMSITEKRKESVAFSAPYYNASIVVLTKKDSKFANAKGINDLAGAVVTSQLNTIWYDLIPQIPSVQAKPAIDNVPSMIVALDSGKVEALILDRPTALAAVHSNPRLVAVEFKDGNGFKVSNEDVEMGVAVAKNNTTLLDQINAKLTAISEADRDKLMEEAIKNQPLSK